MIWHIEQLPLVLEAFFLVMVLSGDDRAVRILSCQGRKSGLSGKGREDGRTASGEDMECL
jgi:hypothetical protein